MVSPRRHRHILRSKGMPLDIWRNSWFRLVEFHTSPCVSTYDDTDIRTNEQNNKYIHNQKISVPLGES